MLKHIQLDNFRCFKHYELDFTPRVNLLIGDNGSGKTSIIKAIILALNSFFKGFSDENTNCTGIGVGDFNHTINDGAKSMTQSVSISFKTDRYDYINVFRKSVKGGTTYPESNQFIKDCRFIQSRVTLESQNNERQTPLPLYAYYATDDIHGYVQNVRNKDFRDYFLAPSFGYYLTLKGGYFLKNWIDRLLVLKEGDKGAEELEIVRQALITFLGKDGCNIIDDISIRPIQKYVYFHFVDGREVRYEDLSDGYRRLVNIVLDLAFRCSALNRTLYHSSCCEQTEGVVCIDELDDHLHPALQSSVIKSLQHTFPRLQFIVSTHAPLIMTSVEDSPENQVVQLGYENNEYSHHTIDTYGLDASTIIRQYLHVADRDKYVETELDELSALIDKEKVEEAKALLNKLRNKYSDRIPELSNAEALLSFYE